MYTIRIPIFPYIRAQRLYARRNKRNNRFTQVPASPVSSRDLSILLLTERYPWQRAVVYFCRGNPASFTILLVLQAATCRYFRRSFRDNVSICRTSAGDGGVSRVLRTLQFFKKPDAFSIEKYYLKKCRMSQMMHSSFVSNREEFLRYLLPLSGLNRNVLRGVYLYNLISTKSRKNIELKQTF